MSSVFCLGVCPNITYTQYPWIPEGGDGSLGTSITDGCQQVFSVLHFQDSSPALRWSSLSFTEVWKVYNKAIKWSDPSLAFFLVGFKTETKTEQQEGQEDELKSTDTF